jgi:hypothetical protein
VINREKCETIALPAIADPAIYPTRRTHRIGRKERAALTGCSYEELIVVEEEMRGAVPYY